MSVFSSPGAAYRAVPAAGCGAESRGLVRAGRAAGAAFLLAVLGGLSLAAGAAQANTFPGTNGVLVYSAEIATEPTNTGSAYEIVSKSASGTSGVERRCTVNENTDVMPKVSKDGKMIAWLKDQNVWTMSLSEIPGSSGVWQCPYNMDGSLPAGVTAGTPRQVTTGNLDSWLGGWSQWEEPAGTENTTSDARKAWLFFSRRDAGPPANFEVFKAQVDKDGAKVTGTSPVNVTNYAVDPGPPAGTTGITDSQPDLCDGATTKKLVWTSNRTGTTIGTGPLKTDVWEQSLDVNYALTGSATNRSGENTVFEEGAASYKPGDCTKIAFQTDRTTGTGTPTPPRNLDIFRTEGTGVKQLTYNPPTLPTNAGLTDVTGYDVTPQWSPDATRICFHSGRAKEEPQWMLTAGLLVLGQWEVYTLDAANGEYDAAANPGGTPSTRETTREYNDERCGWQEAP